MERFKKSIGLFFLLARNKKVTLSIDSATYGAFQDYCEEHAIMLSKKIELWMKEELVKEKNEPKK